MAWPRFVWGETSRERELRALADSQARHAEELRRRIAADEKAHAAALAALREQLVQAIDQRNAARVILDGFIDQRDAARADRDAAERRLKAAIDERDAAIAALDDARDERDAARADRDDARDDAREARRTISDVAANLRCIWEAIDANDSQDDRPAQDCGTDGAGMEPE